MGAISSCLRYGEGVGSGTVFINEPWTLIIVTPSSENERGHPYFYILSVQSSVTDTRE